MEDAGDAKGAVTKSRLPTEHVLQGSLSTKEAKSGRASPTDASEKRSMGAPVKSYLRIFTYNDGLGWALNIIAFGCMVASGTLLPLMDIVFGKFVTIFNKFVTGNLGTDEFLSEVSRFSLWFIYLFIAKFLLTYICNVLISLTAIRTTKVIRVKFLRQVLRQEIGYFDSPDAGSITGQITSNGDFINVGISEKLGLVIQAVSTFVAAFVVAFAVQWKLTLIIVGIVPASLIVTMVSLAMDTKYEQEAMRIYAKASLVAEEVFSSIRNVHAFWIYDRMSMQYGSILEQSERIGHKKSPVLAVLYSFEFFCVYAAYGLAFWQGIRRYASGEISEPGQIVTVIFAIIVAAQALTQVAPQIVQISKAAASADELFRVIDRNSEIDPLLPSGSKPDECRGQIEMQDIGFAYPSRPSIPILDKLTLSIPAKRTTAIVGTSGSGKSTIIGLLERWYTPSKGVIKLDGQNIEDLNLNWLRTNIRLVQQEPVLFSGSIFENVEHGLAATELASLPSHEKEALVREACKVAFAHEFIEKLPEGYNTQLGQRGAMLSGGQKQRIAIARSIISNPRILLLDEATSALDPNSEKEVQKALNNVTADRTMVIIAHRLSTIRSAHNVVVMRKGSIVEQGTYDELVAQGGQFATLVKSQGLAKAQESRQDEPAPEDQVDQSVKAVDEATSLVDPATPPSVLSAQSELGKRHGLAACIAIVLREQHSLGMVLVVGLGCCIIAGLTYPAIAVIFSRALDVLGQRGSALTSGGDFYALMFLVVALANLLAYAVFGWVSNILAQHILKSYRLELFNNIMKHDMAFFDKSTHSTGSLVSRLSAEPQNIMELLSMNIGMILVNVINVASSCILAVIVGWKLGLVLTLGALPPLLIAGYVRIRLEAKLDEDSSERFANSAGYATEATLAIRTVASLALESQIIERFEKSLQSVAERSFRTLGWKMLWYSLSQSISFLAMALGFWYGGQLMSRGEYSSNQFYTVFVAVIFSGEAAAMFFQFTTSITKARGAINYVLAMRLQVRPDMNERLHDKDEADKIGPGDQNGAAIEMQGLQFAYPQRPLLTVLKGINARIEPGKFVAFVGASGSGKSTIINLLERFYEPTSGKILYDEEDSTKKTLGSYRSGVALVQQEPVLYQGSIRDNIALGLLNPKPPSDEAIMAAATAANIRDFILSLPEGLNTPCGALGMQLSGGQRQRIAIARALIRNSRLLLLDEATSALDTESEKVVQAALDQASDGRTTIAVAHRLSTVRDADCIFVFANGCIAEAGTHSELLDLKGLYFEMCMGQGLDQAIS